MNLPHVINFDQPEDSNQETPQSNSSLKGAYLRDYSRQKKLLADITKKRFLMF